MKRRTSESRIRQLKIHREAEGYLELNLPRQALSALARLGDPAHFETHAMYLWGEALRAMERYEEALIPLSRAAQADRNLVHVWVALGWCYKRTGQIQQAIEALETARRIAPKEPLLHYNLACYFSLAGDKRQMLDHLSTALSLEPAYLMMIEDESDFDPVRGDGDFQALCENIRVGQ